MRPYFAYGTTQAGFVHQPGEPIGRFRTVEAHSIVVPRAPACSNPGCRYNHRMAALVPGHWNLHAQGDVYEIEDFDALDALELSGPYVRQELEIISLEGATTLKAQAYPAQQPLRWAELVWAGLADALESYPRELAETEFKACCVSAPGHEPPHDVIDPLDPARLDDQRLRNLARGFVKDANPNLHILEATAAATPYPSALSRAIHFAFIESRVAGTGTAELQTRIAQALDQTAPAS